MLEVLSHQLMVLTLLRRTAELCMLVLLSTFRLAAHATEGLLERGHRELILGFCHWVERI